jgi:hypothetical protein
MSARCTRLWQVEAARDQRLPASEVTSLERHLTSCSECRNEQRLLEQLAGRMREGAVASPDELEHRRLRRALLERADAALRSANSAEEASEPKAAGGPFSRAALLAAVLFMLLGFGAAYALPGARGAGSSSREGGVADLQPKVAPPGSADLELTDCVANDRQRALSAPDTALHTQPTQPEAAQRPRLVPRTATRPAAQRTPSEPGDLPAAPAAQLASPTSTAEPAANEEEEDLAYLRIVALLREQRTDEARLAARKYLGQFPQGFRHIEVERVLR